MTRFSVLVVLSQLLFLLFSPSMYLDDFSYV